MIKVSVTSTEVRNQSGNSKATGNPYSINFQTVWVHTTDKQGNLNPYPEKVEIILDKNKEGQVLFYPVGDYLLGLNSIYVDRSGNLAVSPKLVSPPKPKAIG